jgi:tetratricopeptide (TPR) repeat protein
LVTLRRLATRPIAYGILWFFVALAPTSSVVPLYQIANDHRTFLPYIGLSLSVAWCFALLVLRYQESLASKRALWLAVVALPTLVILAHAVGVRQRNEVWSSGESLWYDVTIKSPTNGRGLMNYGLTQMRKGSYPTALEYFERALEFTPSYSYLHVNLGIVRGAMGDQEQARAHFDDALRYGPETPAVHFYFAKWLSEQGRRAEAISHLETVLRLSPGHRKAAELLTSLRRDPVSARDSEIVLLQEQVAEQATAAGYLDLSFAYYKADRLEECIDASWKALEFEPSSSIAYNNICTAYIRLGDLDRAIASCQRALELDPDFGRARANLGWALDLKFQEPGGD